jgi:hypothetical protein
MVSGWPATSSAASMMFFSSALGSLIRPPP